MNKLAILIDGEWLRKALISRARKIEKSSKKTPYIGARIIKEISLKMPQKDEHLLRIYYYDAKPFDETRNKPDGSEVDFKDDELYSKEYRRMCDFQKQIGKFQNFALRTGSLNFKGWNNESKPIFGQKGVDMRLGLDIASLSIKRLVDRIALVSGDADMVPAMKFARREGVQIVLVRVEEERTTPVLLEHADYIRTIDLPDSPAASQRPS